jgi:hypothetical protein
MDQLVAVSFSLSRLWMIALLPHCCRIGRPARRASMYDRLVTSPSGPTSLLQCMFYERFGFKRCPDGRFGVGMYLRVQIEA